MGLTAPIRPQELGDFICKQCGRCCLHYGRGLFFSAGLDQLEIWELDAPKLMDWLIKVPYVDIYEGWLSPVTGEENPRCPWLREHRHPRWKRQGFHCTIYQHRPPDCQVFPENREHMLSVNCQGLNHLTSASSPQSVV